MAKAKQESSRSFVYLCLTCILCWLGYSCVTIFNYAESVVSGMKSDLSQYFVSNEKISAHLSEVLPMLEESHQSNQHLKLTKIKSLGIEGFNITPDQFSEYVGALVAQGDVAKVPFNLSLFMHELDRCWAEEDNSAPGAFFTYYGKNQEFAYTKNRQNLNAQPPQLTPFRYRKEDISLDYKKPILTTLERSYPKGNSIVVLITPVFVDDKLVGDLGMRLKLEELMLGSLGPWLSQYMVLDIQFRDQTFSIGEHRFLPQILFKKATYNGITITAYMGTDYITKYILPWFLSMLFIMAMVYCVLNKHRKEVIRFSSLSKTDELTGLFNKRVLDEMAAMGVEQGTLFYIDVNDFKFINDNYGHQVGDDALRYIASGMRQCMRASDVCIRLGGDEFLVITNTKIINPEKIRRKLQKVISGAVFSQDITLSISIGYSHFDDIEVLTQSIHQADKQMYEEKNRYKGHPQKAL